MNSRDVIRSIEGDGWRLKRVTGSHHHFAHPSKPGLVTVMHPAKDIKLGTP
jgi:predicted RNA binding protein YcfA (HicA-like mRNA interferase family)